MTSYKRIIQLELNEITPSVIIDLVARGKLPNFKQVLSTWYYRDTYSESEYQYLEPWIQWISAHTGKSFSDHQIFHLSDAAQLRYPQIWETLSDKGIQSAIIGSMNARQGSAQGGIFFPDPWSKEGKTFPERLQPLWDLISQKVQGHATSTLTLKNIIDGLRVTSAFNLPMRLYAKIAMQLIRQKTDPLSRWRMAGCFDLFLSEIFFNVLKTTPCGFYTLFLNSVAHYQHHYWRNYSTKGFNAHIYNQDCHKTDDPMTFGYELYDQILGKLLAYTKNDKDTLIIIASGLSQQPFTEDDPQGGMHYYRLIDHQQFLNQLHLNSIRAYPLMSRDWQITADDSALLKQAAEKLSALTIAGKAVFNIKQNDNNSFFIETAITTPCDNNTMIMLDNQTIMPFLTAFRHIAIKNGHHSGNGGLWLSGPCGHITTKTANTHVFIGELYDITLAGI